MMAKTHYATVERANESDNNDYWSATLCGLEYTESPLSDKWFEVTCKHCLKKGKQSSLTGERSEDDQMLHIRV